MNLALLLATLLALAAGPFIYALARHQPRLLKAVDTVIVVSIGLLVLVEVLPETFAAGGLWSLLFLGLGLLGPTVVEHLLTRARREAHIAALLLAIVGLVLHSTGDGAALSPAGTADGHEALAFAVVLHSLPVGLLVWWLLFPNFGYALPSAAIAAMCTGTVAGYWFGVSLSAVLGAQAWAWLQALVAGSLLHVVLGRPHLHAGGEHHH